MKPIKIGKYEIEIPIVQGGMGVGITWDVLPGTVSNLGGLGTVSSIGTGYYKKGEFIKKIINNRPFESINFYSREAIFEIFREARKICGNKPLACNVLYAINDYARVVIDSIEAGANMIVTGAGLPLDLPEITKKYPDVALIPIVSSGKALKVLCRRWEKKNNRLPDAVIVEGPLSGGHQGFKKEDIFKEESQLESILPQVLEERDKWGDFPVIAAGGIWDRRDIDKFIELGADGVQMATRFIATHESGASNQFKDVLINCKKEDISIVASPVGHPARAITSELFLNPTNKKIPCISNCVAPCERGIGANKVGYCIANSLGDALSEEKQAKNNALYFTGSNGYKIEKIVSVQEVFDELLNK